MKFSHGVWTMRDGVDAFYAARVSEHATDNGKLLLTCLNRGEPSAILNTYAITIELSSPLPDVVRVHVRHQLGRKPHVPVFPLDYALSAAAQIAETPETLTFKSGELEVVVSKRPFGMRFLRKGELVCESGSNALGAMYVKDDRDYLMQRLSLGVGEGVYGLGERFGALVKNGQSISIWNEDPGTATDLAYKSVPFYLTSKGHAVLINHPGRVDVEVATERLSAVQFSVPDQELDYYVFAGADPKSSLDLYTRLSGRPALPPLWTFGLWLSTSFTTNYDEKIVGSFIDGMFERNIPLSVFHFDCLWMREHHWCDFTWDPAKFPDPKAMLARIKARGVKICVWINPYISELSSIFAEGRDRGYFLKRANGDVYQRHDWQPGIALVDFTNPAASKWYQSKLLALLEMGVDCFKTDFGERVPADAVYFDGSDAGRMHNYYSYLYNEAVFSLLEEFHGKGGAAVFARSATACCQKFPVHWGGDCDATWESMAETLRGGLSFGLSGGAFWSHDISGFNATASPAIYKRWVAFGLLSSHSRLHGSSSYRVPWLFDEESVDVLRSFTELKQSLMPYLWSVAHEAQERGAPMLRAMLLEFPADPAAAALDRQYMLGGSLLVAPVFNDAGDVSYYLPHGTWTDYFTGAKVEGGTWREERALSFSRIPLYVRPNTLLAVGTRNNRPDYDFTRELRLEVFELGDGADVVTRVHAPDSARQISFRCVRSGARLTLRAEGAAGLSLDVVLRNVANAEVVSGGRASAGPRGARVAWADAGKELVLDLRA